MIKSKPFSALIFAAVLITFYVSCSHLDVRMGMGDGNGVGLSYRIVGKGNPLVVIHDGPGYEKSLMYAGFDNLASDLRVIYYDQRGCGRSEPLSPVTSSTIADNIEDLEALRRYFHLEKFSIAAHGWGAVIALEYTRKYQKYIDSIVLLTPISPFSPQPRDETILERLPAEVQQSVAEVLSQPTMSMLERKERIMKLVMPSLFYRSEASRSIDFRRLRYSADVNIRLSDELGSLNLFPVLGEITVPTLVVIGRHDITTPVRDQMAYADGIRSASAVVFNGSGHFPFVEEHAFFTNVVREFLLNGRIPALVHAVDVR
ncbi:MAG: alpha/beta hydrolase [Candidatus Eisenbacteria bacterium]